MRRILNIGCGSQTYGTDFVDTYPSRPEIRKCAIGMESLPYPDNTFDEVYSRCLLEHTKNVFDALEEMVRVLKPSGRLVVITDNAGYLFFHILTPHGNYFKKRDDRHYALFQKEHLRNILKTLNLKVESIKYVDWEWKKPVHISLANWILRRIKPTLGYPWIKAIAFKVKK